MNYQLQADLFNKYPRLFKQVTDSPETTCMCWGIECHDGWYTIIDELAAKLEPLGIEAEQVKEKFGTLRVYVSYSDDNIRNIIKEAEAKSLVTCEICGQAGELNKGPWLKVRCKEHE